MAKTFIQTSRTVGAAEKAAFHQVTGAGKAHVKRPFFGLSRADEDVVIARVADHLDQILRRAAV